jgi:hypothetical protein
MVHVGGCHCGAVRYEASGTPQHVSICHCGDCRKSAGAPFVSWAAFSAVDFRVIRGEPKAFNSSGSAFRHFCADCGSGLYYVNEQVLPGLVDIQTSTLDDPDALEPVLQIQAAEKLKWVAHMDSLPSFDRYPG